MLSEFTPTTNPRMKSKRTTHINIPKDPEIIFNILAGFDSSIGVMSGLKAGFVTSTGFRGELNSGDGTGKVPTEPEGSTTNSDGSFICGDASSVA